jgi:hypothetical protein
MAVTNAAGQRNFYDVYGTAPFGKKLGSRRACRSHYSSIEVRYRRNCTVTPITPIRLDTSKKPVTFRASALLVAGDRRWRGNPDLLMVKSI